MIIINKTISFFSNELKLMDTELILNVIRVATIENRSSGFQTRSGTNRPVQSQKQARSLKFWI